MNRIRKVNNLYEVLITPHHVYDSSMELILGNWKDEDLADYSIKTFDTLNDAMAESYLHPDILWNKLSDDHIDNFKILNKKIREIIEKYNFIVDIKSSLLTGNQIKNCMFDRVKRNDGTFRLINQMNDIISFYIINPWTNNCAELGKIIVKDTSFKIIKHSIFNKIINLVGETDIGTTYQIIILPTLMYQFIEWKNKDRQLNQNTISNNLSQIIKAQDMLDKTVVLR